MSHSYNCPHCGDSIGPNAREISRWAYCSNCGENSTNREGWLPCPTCHDDCGWDSLVGCRNEARNMEPDNASS